MHTPGNGLRKLFGVFRDESKWFKPSMCWLNTFSAMSSLSLQDNICGPPPPVYLYTVKIENFRHTLMSSLRSALNNKNKGLYTQEFIHDLKPVEYVKVILQSLFSGTVAITSGAIMTIYKKDSQDILL